MPPNQLSPQHRAKYNKDTNGLCANCTTSTRHYFIFDFYTKSASFRCHADIITLFYDSTAMATVFSPNVFRAFVRAREGVAALEFALISFIFFLFIMGIVELGIITFLSSVVEGTTSMTARFGKTGYTAGGDPIEEVKEEFYKRTRGLVDIKKLHICINPSSDFNSASIDPPCLADNDNTTRPSSVPNPIDRGTRKQVVVYTVTYEWPIITPALLPFFQGDARKRSGVAYLSSVTTVRNE